MRTAAARNLRSLVTSLREGSDRGAAPRHANLRKLRGIYFSSEKRALPRFPPVLIYK